MMLVSLRLSHSSHELFRGQHQFMVAHLITVAALLDILLLSWKLT
jgi:hypothetical protein